MQVLRLAVLPYTRKLQLVIDNGQGCVDTLSYTVGDIDSIQCSTHWQKKIALATASVA